jgi:hypothetical protein
MLLPTWLVILGAVLIIGLTVWSFLLASGRNPLPFPDPGSRIFTAASPEAKEAVVELLARHGLRERFQANSSGILRSILWDGTIINHADAGVRAKLDNPTSSIGLVADDPVVSANAAADFLTSRGFTARVVLDAEPAIPIAFVVSDVFLGTVINFRKHMIHLPRPQPAPRR